MDKASESHNNKGRVEEKKYSTSELMASAKVVAEAAQSSFGKGSEKKNIDKAKVAKAAGDLLDAVGQYAKLDDEKGLGQYVDKAADYLHHYKQPTNTSSVSSKPDHPKGHHDDDKGQSHGGSGGLGDFAKVAGGFFK